MGLTATDKGGEYETTPEGTYVARCYKIIDLGTQISPTFGTSSHQVMVSWELFDDEKKTVDGRPYQVSQFYTVSLNEKANLRKHLEAWRGKKFTPDELDGFDLNNVLGSYCMIQVVHSQDGKYANVNAIMSYKGEKPAPVNEDVIFDIDEPNMSIYGDLSDNMRAKIAAAPEWKATSTQPSAKELTDSTPVKQDRVIDDLGNEEINLADIPF